MVLLVGRLAKEKNVGLVISAFRAIQQSSPAQNWCLWATAPCEAGRCRQVCPEAMFAGVQKGEELATHYASGDLFLFPSLTETFGNVVPEALASGLALVCYGCAAAQELITSGVNGILVPAMMSCSSSMPLSHWPDPATSLTRTAPGCAASVAHLHWDAIYDSFVGHLTQVSRAASRISRQQRTAPVDAMSPSRQRISACPF